MNEEQPDEVEAMEEIERLAAKCDVLAEQVAKVEDYRIMQTLLEVKCERLAAENARLRALILSREWDGEGFCQWCYALRTNGHADHCPWQFALGGDA